jgi:predicted transcriptional regulator
MEHSAMSDSDKVRLQIHVDEELAERIDSLAARMNRSTAWMVAELLVQAMDEQERFLDWITWRVVALAGFADPRKVAALFKKKPRPLCKGVTYLQTHVTQEVVQQLDRLAAADQRSRADMATLVLNWVMDDEEWLLRAVTNRWFAAMYDGLGLKRGEQAPGNGEENRKRRPDDGIKETAERASDDGLAAA